MLNSCVSRFFCHLVVTVCLSAIFDLSISAAFAAKDDTILVTGKGDGTIAIQIQFADGTKVNKNVSATNAQSEGQVATDIQDAINTAKPGSATASGQRVSIPSANHISITVVTPKGSAGSLSAGVNHSVAAIDLPVGNFSFDPSMATGGTITTADATISGGFDSGIAPVSFAEPAGTTIEELASALNAALLAGGYSSTLSDTTNVEVFGIGAVLPAEFILSATTNGAGDLGVGLNVSDVPEPGMMILLVAGVLILLGWRWRSDTRRQQNINDTILPS